MLLDNDSGESLTRVLDDVEVVKEVTAEEERPSAEAGTLTVRDKRHYWMLGEIDFTHPMFAAFANPRYGDFTKIHFWRRKLVRLKEPSATRAVARFDSGDPAVLVRSCGSGRVIVFTSGWQPDESQLVLSSKFVPLVQALIDLASGGPAQTASLTVGDPVPLPRTADSSAILEKPDGARMTLAAGAKEFSDADQPGIYRLHLDGEEYPFAVNVAATESKTEPMDLDRLEQLGVRLSANLTRAQRAEQVRQQRDTELESRQRLWRWLIVEAIALLILETWLAGRATKKLQTALSAA
jgi:hypothetical protein